MKQASPRQFRTTLPVALAAATLVLAACARRTEPPLSQEPFSVQATLSTNTARIGDLLELRLTADHPEGSEVRVPEIARGKEMVVREQKSESRPLADHRVRTTRSYKLTSLVVGEHLVSTGKVQCIQGDQPPMDVPFPLVRFNVVSVLAATNTAPRDIKGLAKWPAAFPRWAVVLLVIALLAAAAALLLARVLSKPRTILQYPLPPPPHEVAIAALRNLLSRGWIETGQIEPFYVELSSIVRRYIEDRFGLRAPERTTEEFIREAASSRLLSADHQLLTRDFLEQCDLVKFAKHRPGAPEMRAGFDAAERLVMETVPIPPQPSTPDPQPFPISHSP